MFKNPEAMDQAEFDEAAKQAATHVILQKVSHDKRFALFTSLMLVLGAAGFGGAGTAVLNALQIPNPLAVDSCFTSLAAAILRRASRGDKVTNDMRTAIENFPDQTIQVIVDALASTNNETVRQNLLTFLGEWFPHYHYADPRVLSERSGLVRIPHYDSFDPFLNKNAA